MPPPELISVQTEAESGACRFEVAAGETLVVSYPELAVVTVSSNTILGSPVRMVFRTTSGGRDFSVDCGWLSSSALDDLRQCVPGSLEYLNHAGLDDVYAAKRYSVFMGRHPAFFSKVAPTIIGSAWRGSRLEALLKLAGVDETYVGSEFLAEPGKGRGFERLLVFCFRDGRTEVVKGFYGRRDVRWDDFLHFFSPQAVPGGSLVEGLCHESIPLGMVTDPGFLEWLTSRVEEEMVEELLVRKNLLA